MRSSLDFQTLVRSSLDFQIARVLIDLMFLSCIGAILDAFVFFLFESMSVALLMSMPNGVLSISSTKFRFKCSRASELFYWIMSSVM